MAIALAGCGGHAGSQRVSLTTVSPSPLIDTAPEIRASGLEPGSAAVLRATWAGFGGVRATSLESVRADANGKVVVRGFDGLRLLWSMRVTPEKAGFTVPATGDAPVDLALENGGKTVARAVLHRRAGASTVKARFLFRRRDGLVGLFASPAPSAGGRPAVVVLGGSEGGLLGADLAALLASHGYPALVLGYFGLPGLPRNLIRIPLEYFERGLRWLARQPSVDPHRISVMGISRGGEAALLTATTFPKLVHATVALVTSAEVLIGLDGRSPAWTYRGKPIPLEPIPVERARGPILVVGAGKDALVPSSTYTAQIEQRLDERHYPYFHQRLDYPQAGHDIGFAIPYLPQPDPIHFGGSPRASALAKARLWPALLDFLRHHA